VDLKQALLVLPANVYKSDDVHVVPLVLKAVEILDLVLTYHMGRSGEHLFSGTDGRRSLSGRSHGRARMLAAIRAITGEDLRAPWTPHDLRRTVATRIAEKLATVVSAQSEPVLLIEADAMFPAASRWREDS
jgi:integrase